MKLKTLKLLLPVVAITIQNNSASTIIPPFLQDLHISVAALGTLISLNPILALVSRLPVGMAYNPRGARLLISIAVLVMGISNFFYSFASDGLTFAIVHSINGFAYGAVTTLYMAFYVDSLPPEENRNHAMGYYVGTLALGYSTGNVFGGLIADHYGYGVTFQLAAFLSLIPCVLLWLFRGPGAPVEGEIKPKTATRLTSRDSWKALLEPELAIVVITAVFLNLLHQMGGVFISLYGLGVGMSLTQIGVIRAAFAGCNAVTRPISGHVVSKFGHRRLSYAGIPLQSAILTLIPLFTGFGTVLTIYRGREQSAARAGLRNLQCGGRPRKLPRPDDRRSHRSGHQHRQRFYYRTARNNGAVSDWDLGGAAAAQPCNRSSKSVLIEKLLSTISASLTRVAPNTPGPDCC